MEALTYALMVATATFYKMAATKTLFLVATAENFATTVHNNQINIQTSAQLHNNNQTNYLMHREHVAFILNRVLSKHMVSFVIEALCNSVVFSLVSY